MTAWRNCYDQCILKLFDEFTHSVLDLFKCTYSYDMFLLSTDPGTVLNKHDHLEPDHLSIATAGTTTIHKPTMSHKRQAHTTSSNTPSGSSTPNTTHHDDKHDHKPAIKRQRRQRQQDVKEEEKKVSWKNRLIHH